MSRAVILINCQAARDKAKRWIDKAPWNARVTFQGPKRSLPQNDRFWASLTDVAEQAKYHGLKLSPDDWKALFMDALKREVRVVPNLDGNGMVALGRSSSNLSKEEMGDLLEIIYAWGSANGVVFQDHATGESGSDAAQELHQETAGGNVSKG
jgi:hypothetical protein